MRIVAANELSIDTAN